MTKMKSEVGNRNLKGAEIDVLFRARFENAGTDVLFAWDSPVLLAERGNVELEQ